MSYYLYLYPLNVFGWYAVHVYMYTVLDLWSVNGLVVHVILVLHHLLISSILL